MKFSGKVGSGPVSKAKELKFGGDPEHWSVLWHW